MKGILQTFYRKPKVQRKITELVDGVLIGLYDEETFANDMGAALKKAYAKYGETRHVLVVDVSATGPEDWMDEILPGVVVTAKVHLGPYFMVPSLSSIFEVCADAYDYLNSGFKAGSQHLVLIIARNQLCEEYRPLTAIALIASAYLTYVAIIENAVVSLEHFKKTVKDACMCSERQLKQDTLIPNLYQYLRYFTMVRINKRFPNSRPLQLAKILVQGDVTIDDQPWNPILRIYQAGEDSPQCKTIMQKDNGLDGDVMIGTGYASFVLNEVIHGDIVISFEHWNPLSEVTKPLFAIARHTGFLEPPYHRILYTEIESAPGLANKVELDPESFGVDLFFEEVATPSGIDPHDFSEAAMHKYATMLDLETAELIGKVADLCEIAEEIASHAPNGPPPCMQAISASPHGKSAQGADFTKEILQKNAERERRKAEQLEAVEDAESKRKAKLLEKIIDGVGTAGVDEFVEVFMQYNEEIAGEEQVDPEARKGAARQVLGKTYVHRRSSPHGTAEVSSEEDAFGDIARYIDEEELDDIDAWRRKMAAVKRESISSGEETTEETEDDATDEKKDADVLHDAVQVLLRGVKKTGRTDRFRADEALKNAVGSIDESDIIEQITGALQKLVEESRAEAEGGNSRKFFSTQEVVDKVKVMRHEADPSRTPKASSLPPPFPGTAPTDGKKGAPPPPPPPLGGVAPLIGGPRPPPPPPPPRRNGGPKLGVTPPPPPPPPGKTMTGAPPPPPPPPGRKMGGPPPPPPPGGLKKPGLAPPLLPLNGAKSRGAPGTNSSVSATAVPAKPVKRNDTKRLNWNPISNMRLGKTLYAQDEFQEHAALDEDTEKELLEKFSNRPPPKMFDTAKQEKAEEAEKKGPRTAGILEQKRMTNTLIMLRKFDCSPKEIAEAVKRLDPLAETLSFENVNALFTYGFKDEELEMAKNYAAPEAEVAKLNTAEALAYHVARVPRWNVKVRAMVTMRTAKEVNSEIRNSLSTVTAASKEVLGSKRFRQILATILAVGNFLNAGTAKGSARGFKLETLTKLNETKAREKGINLMHYITGLAEKKSPDLLTFAEDMPSVAKAKRIAKEDIAKELTTFQRAVTLLGREVTMMIKEEDGKGDKKLSLPSTPPPSKSARRLSNMSNNTQLGPISNTSLEAKSDSTLHGKSGQESEQAELKRPSPGNNSKTALSVAKDVYSTAEEAVADLEKLQEEMLRVFNELAIQLGEDPKHVKTEELFSTLWDFIGSFNQSANENKTRKEEAERKERLAKRLAEDQEKRRRRASQRAEGEKIEDSTSSTMSLQNSPGSPPEQREAVPLTKDQVKP